MSGKGKPAWPLMVGMLAAGLIAGGIAGFWSALSQDSGQGPLGSALIAGGGVVVLMIGTIVYWTRLDEAAREAHKWAFYWGGSVGIAVAVVALPVLLALPEGADVPGYAGREDEAGAAAFGVMGTLGCVIAGYTAAWLWWWWRRR